MDIQMNNVNRDAFDVKMLSTSSDIHEQTALTPLC